MASTSAPGPVRLTPAHGRILEAALTALQADYRRAGARRIDGVEALVEVARQLREDGARLVVSPGLATGGQGSPSVDARTARSDAGGVTRLVGRHEIASVLGVSPRTVDRRVADGTLACRRIGSRVLFDPVTTIKETERCTTS